MRWHQWVSNFRSILRHSEHPTVRPRCCSAFELRLLVAGRTPCHHTFILRISGSGRSEGELPLSPCRSPCRSPCCSRCRSPCRSSGRGGSLVEPSGQRASSTSSSTVRIRLSMLLASLEGTEPALAGRRRLLQLAQLLSSRMVSTEERRRPGGGSSGPQPPPPPPGASCQGGGRGGGTGGGGRATAAESARDSGTGLRAWTDARDGAPLPTDAAVLHTLKQRNASVSRGTPTGGEGPVSPSLGI